MNVFIFNVQTCNIIIYYLIQVNYFVHISNESI